MVLVPVSGHAPQPVNVKLNSSDAVARVRQYRAGSPGIATRMRLTEHQATLIDKRREFIGAGVPSCYTL